MKIALVSRANARGGGASRIAEDSARWFAAEGHDTAHFVSRFIGEPASFQHELFPRGWRGGLIRRAHAITRSAGLSQLLPLDHWLWYRKIFADFDVVHFHDHAAAFSMTGIALLAETKPVFFTAHDFLHATGGCIYPMACTAYKTHCGSCPQKNSIGRFDFTGFNHSVNRWAARRHDIHFVYPSDWLRREATLSLRPRIPGVTLPNAFDPSSYSFVSRRDARRALGLAETRPLLCISAHYLNDARKGVEFALRAIASVADLRPLVILIGNALEGVEKRIPGIDFWFSGLVDDRKRMGLILAASDLFLFTSLQDNLPITIQETMAARTPVVGFATGGAVELVEHGRTGWLVTTGDQAALDALLRNVLTRENPAAVGEAAAAEVARRYAPAVFVRRHVELYTAALAHRSSPSALTDAPAA